MIVIDTYQVSCGDKQELEDGMNQRLKDKYQFLYLWSHDMNTYSCVYVIWMSPEKKR